MITKQQIYSECNLRFVIYVISIH